MIDALNRLIVRISRSRSLFILTLIIAVGAFQALMRVGEDFPSLAGGAQPFDLQNGLSVDDVLLQLPGYSSEARQQYYLFTAIDYVFPLAAGLMLAAIAAFCMRYALPTAFAAVNARRLFPLLLLASLFDWCENVAAVTAIASYPATTSVMATALVIAKRLKLGFLVASQSLTLLLMLAAAGRWLRNRLRPA